MVRVCLPSKHEALTSDPSAARKKRKKKRKRKAEIGN
jgi:hypothetical protein